MPDYLPPCFWTSAAFSPTGQKIVHQHPFRQYEDTKVIEERLAPFSVFSWPFRLGYNHSKEKRAAQGTYAKDLPERISRFVSKFEPCESIIFFYMNYDNPVSGNEEEYALVGCAVVNKKPSIPPDFPFNRAELQDIRRPHEMKHFPTMNWAIQISYDFENTGVILPYHEYLEFIKKNPDKRQWLEDIRILVEEDSLIFGFKYVLADIDEDQCILLLTKLWKAADAVEAHDIVDFSREKKIIEQLLEKAWKRRGLYPGLPSVIDYMLGTDEQKGKIIAQKLLSIGGSVDPCESLFSIISNYSDKLPPSLAQFEDEFADLRGNWVQYAPISNLLKKLCLFNLKSEQVYNIVRRNKDSFTNEVSSDEIINNPYVLCEEYKYELTPENLDEETIEDGYVDLFKIDIGMFPKFVKRNSALQNLAQAGPERLRAIIIDRLYSAGEQGDCYLLLEDLCKSIQENPLFYKRELPFTKDLLLSEQYLMHFKKKLTLKESEAKYFFYLNEVVRAEEIIRNVVTELLERTEHKTEIKDVEAFVKAEAEKLKSKKIKRFNESQFCSERTRVLKTLPKQSFYVISGKPGTGKTKVLEKIIGELEARHEKVTVVAPTGKASIRLKLESNAKAAQTIDRFIYADQNDYRSLLEDFALILKNGRETPIVGNLIVDESSMVDLQKLATLFLMVKLHGAEGNRIDRIIMVGDEDQLPPIGFGKPYYDIIQYLKMNEKYVNDNYIKLSVNCRNELDPKIIEFADVFSGKNRYYNEVLDEIMNSKKPEVSEGLTIEKWTTYDELGDQINRRLKRLFDTELKPEELSLCEKADDAEKLNLLFGLHPNGFVKGPWEETLGIDNFQILTPYRTEPFGSMNLSNFIKLTYPRGHWADSIFGGLFNHSDKIIRRSNEYVFDWLLKRRILRLSNGSMGIVNNKQQYHRIYYFTDQEYPIKSVGYNPLKEDEDLELAYAVTVHKAQGSDFKNVFLVVPAKKALLCKELLYTALTRSKRSLTVFVQKQEGKEVLEEARGSSAVLQRNTSIFENPQDSKGMFEPSKGESVKSKIEYIIYKALEASSLKFKYEEPLPFEKGPERIRPDFTIWVGNKTYYWEHLGELDLRDYWTKWVARRNWYKLNQKFDSLVTSDDLGGVKNEKIIELIEDIKKGQLKITDHSEFSRHHYMLYG
jgi:ATP-dependent exoDNAse (exonuclease V) alpha subunit